MKIDSHRVSIWMPLSQRSLAVCCQVMASRLLVSRSLACILFTCAVACLVTSGGCASWGDKGDINDRKANQSLMQRLPLIGKKKQDDAPEPYPNPVKMAATWAPDTLVQTGRTPTRGFGGRIFFYNEKSQPVPVEGTLIVHGFDDQADSDQQGAKRFEFTPEQLTRHFGQSDLGASYSIWIPWDAVGGQQRRISLVPSFRTAQGKVVQGVPATVQLPGRKSPETAEDALARYSPQFRRNRQAARSGASRTGLATTTIARHRPQYRRSSPSTRSQPSSNDRPHSPPTLLAGRRSNWMDLTPATDPRVTAPQPGRSGHGGGKVTPVATRLPPTR